MMTRKAPTKTRVRSTEPQPMYRPTDTFERKVAMAANRLYDDICEEHRLMAIRTGYMANRFSQSGQIAYEIYLHKKGR